MNKLGEELKEPNKETISAMGAFVNKSFKPLTIAQKEAK